MVFDLRDDDDVLERNARIIRTLIVDDERLVRERVRDLLVAWPDIEIVGECGDGASAVTMILELRPDLLFLDIQMPEFSGFEVLQIVSDEHLPAVVFVTADDESALEAFEHHALDYLLKPIDPERFAATVRHAMQFAQTGIPEGLTQLAGKLARDRSTPLRIVARRGTRQVILRADEIEWIEAAGNCLRAQTADGECLIRATMESMEDRLDPESFVRVHRSAIVKVDGIESLTRQFHGEYEIRMRDGKLLLSSRTYGAVLRRLRRPET